VIAEHTDEAMEVVRERIEQLDTRVVQVLGGRDRLGAFADPAFLRTFKRAQEGAASSERESDYDMLAALLSERADNPRDRTARAGIERAIEVIDRVDDDALRGLTVMNALSGWSPSSGYVMAGLNDMAALLARLMDGPLPSGGDWIDHLDILNAARITSGQTFRRFDDYYPERFTGYISPGVPEGNVPSTIGGKFENVSWEGFVVNHELRPGYVRFQAASERAARKNLGQLGFDEEHVAEIVTAAKSTFGLGLVDEYSKSALAVRLRETPTFNQIATWWDGLPTAFDLTAVGKVLATANAFRLDTEKFLPRETPHA
jgi:hypothetical protein